MNLLLNRRLVRLIPQHDRFIPERNGINQVFGATYRCRVQSNGTGPASRQLQGKVGGVAPAGLLLIERSAAAPVIDVHCTVGCREYAMKNIADLLMRVWQRSQPASNTQVAVMAESRDRSSMADLVRILRAYDQDQYGRS
jgi:hypothetical protein